jgi:hypothetical protein
MAKITVHGGVSYEPGHEPPGWLPPVPEPEVAAEPAAEAEESAPVPRTPPRRPAPPAGD